ncbi:hypothetical protein PRIPAC_80821, partial [Pristionchus pacificus]|uniref:Uncharacterized protein n=1 Tax=Pristionchus pacificus TaxID=54126 RepID=A0A2A6CKA3_PRIPA
MVAHVITMDAMCIVPVYLLIAFSPTLRSQIFSIWDYLVFGFYGTSIIVELIINIATLNLYVTTVCNFLITSLYVTFQFFVQFFPNSPLSEIAG